MQAKWPPINFELPHACSCIPVVIIYPLNNLVRKMTYGVKEVAVGVDSVDEMSVCKDQECIII